MQGSTTTHHHHTTTITQPPSQALTAEEQAARIQRWADKDPLELHVLLKAFPEEMRTRVAEVGKIKRLVRIHQVRCVCCVVLCCVVVWCVVLCCVGVVLCCVGVVFRCRQQCVSSLCTY